MTPRTFSRPARACARPFKGARCKPEGLEGSLCRLPALWGVHVAAGTPLVTVTAMELNAPRLLFCHLSSLAVQLLRARLFRTHTPVEVA